MPHDDTYLNVSVDPLGGLKSIFLGNFLSSEVPARKYYYNKFNTIKKDFIKIRKPPRNEKRKGTELLYYKG
mgnify:CR=1 FL=1